MRYSLARLCHQTIIAATVTALALCLLLSGAHAAGNTPINLSITTHLGDKQTFREGDIVSFYISMEKDAYVVIVYQDAGGKLNVLLPNSLYPQNFFNAGWFIPIPNEQNPFQFRITAPFGEETLWVFACDKPLPAVAAQTTDHSSGGPNAAIAVIRDTLQKHCAVNHAQFDEASLIITTTGASVTQ